MKKLIMLILPLTIFLGFSGCAQDDEYTYTITYDMSGVTGASGVRVFAALKSGYTGTDCKTGTIEYSGETTLDSNSKGTITLKEIKEGTYLACTFGDMDSQGGTTPDTTTPDKCINGKTIEFNEDKTDTLTGDGFIDCQ